jgi:hypothetical protein
MLTMLKRHEIQVLLRAGHTQEETARLAGVSVRSVRRIADEPPVAVADDVVARAERHIGRPSKAEGFRKRQPCSRLHILSVLRPGRFLT